MQIITDRKEFSFQNTAVTIGKFDGVHRGHMKIIKFLLEKKDEDMTSVVFTFSKTPNSIEKNTLSKSILTNQEKYELYEMIGVDVLIEYPIDKQFMDMSAENFVKQILVKQLGARMVVSGSDFHFGSGRLGDNNLLKELQGIYGYKSFIIDKEKYHSNDISSTRVRESLSVGDMRTVNDLLGYRYSIIGKVVKGNQLGRTVGMPTINLIPNENKLLPPNGVYATRISIDDVIYNGITNVGYKPTVSNEMHMGVEMHVFDFNQEIYGQIVHIEFIEFIRKEKKFSSLEEVKKQVNRDIKQCKYID